MDLHSTSCVITAQLVLECGLVGRWMLMKGSYEVVVRGERAGRGITRHGHGPGMSRTHDSFVAIISWS